MIVGYGQNMLTHLPCLKKYLKNGGISLVLKAKCEMHLRNYGKKIKRMKQNGNNFYASTNKSKIMIADLQRKVDQIDGFYKALKTQEQGYVSQIEDLKKEIDILTKTSAVLKHLLDTMVRDEITKMAGLITYGLKTIFEDQNLTFVPEITKKNEKVHIELKTQNDGVEGDYESFGGSVAVIESFLLRVLCILKKKYSRLLFLDETFASVGEEYIANTGKLVSELSKKLNLDVLLVTHQKEFMHTADHVYRVKESPKGLTMEKTK